MRRTKRNWNTKNRAICRNGPRTNPQKYWAAADAHERANGRLYREVEFALPRELNERARQDVASSFAKQLTGEERLPYTLADPSRRSGRGEPPRSPDVLRTDQ